MIEDTYYSNSPDLNIEKIKLEVEVYAKLQGWKIKEITHIEKGSLPLDLYQSDVPPKKPALGAAAGLAHPVTGYTLPLVLRQIEDILKPANVSKAESQDELVRINTRLRQNFSFYRFLNRMMFKAAAPEKRYIILERFYTLSESLIQRFYAGKSTTIDRVRILVGKPPVPVAKAVRQFKDSI